MKWLIRLAFPALGVLLILIFFGLDDPDTITSTQENDNSETTIPSFEGLVPSPIPTEGPDIVFKWQDSDGNWHYADTPPEHGPWNALAIERQRGNQTPPPQDSETDWQSPYRAPFSLETEPAGNGS